MRNTSAFISDMNATKLFNSLLGLLTVEKGQPISDAEIAKILQISPSTLSRYKSGEIKLDQLDIFLRLLQEISQKFWRKVLFEHLNVVEREQGWFSLPTPRVQRDGIIKLGTMEFGEAELLRNILVTGSTGAGKTCGILKPVISQLCSIYKEDTGTRKKWGGLVCSIKDELLGTLVGAMQKEGRNPLVDIVVISSRPFFHIIKLQDPITKQFWHISGEGPEVNRLLSGSNIHPMKLDAHKGSVFTTGETLTYLNEGVGPSKLEYIETIAIPNPTKYNPLASSIFSSDELANQLVSVMGFESCDTFWKDSCRCHLRSIINIWREVEKEPINLWNLYQIVSSKSALDNLMRELESKKDTYKEDEKEYARLLALWTPITEVWAKLAQPTASTIKGALVNLLAKFNEEENRECFCQKESIDIEECIASGKVILLDAFTDPSIANLIKIQFHTLCRKYQMGADQRLMAYIVDEGEMTECDLDALELTGQTKSFILIALQSSKSHRNHKVARLLEHICSNCNTHIWLKNNDSSTQTQCESLLSSAPKLHTLNTFEGLIWNSNKRGKDKVALCDFSSASIELSATQELEALRWYWKEKLKIKNT